MCSFVIVDPWPAAKHKSLFCVYITDNFTDAAVSGRINGEHKEKDLEPWDGGETHNSDSLESLDTDVVGRCTTQTSSHSCHCGVPFGKKKSILGRFFFFMAVHFQLCLFKTRKDTSCEAV